MTGAGALQRAEGRSVPPEEDEGFTLVLNGYEGPLGLLLDLARRQKVDLRAISILSLAEQYLEYIGRARQLRIEIATEYLLMAAWLAYLKSALLLPEDDVEQQDAVDAAERFQLRLSQLAAMRETGRRLLLRPQLGQDVFACGQPRVPVVRKEALWGDELVDLLRAYAQVEARRSYAPLHMQRPPVVTAEQAVQRLRLCLPDARDWQAFCSFLPADWRTGRISRSAIGSLFAGALELVRAGEADIRQDRAFAPIFLRRKEERAET